MTFPEIEVCAMTTFANNKSSVMSPLCNTLFVFIFLFHLFLSLQGAIISKDIKEKMFDFC